MNRLQNLLFVVLLLALAYFAFAFVYPGPWTPLWLPEREFRYGLDLQGGASLIYQADLSGLPEEEWSNALDGARDVIERRIDFFGVAEPRVAVREGARQLLIELPGVVDFGEALEMIGETPVLQFKEMVEIETGVPGETEVIDEVQARQEAQDILDRITAGEDFASLAREHSDCPSGTQGGDLGRFSFANMVPEFSEAAFALELGKISPELVKTSFGYHIIKKTADEDEEGRIQASHILVSTQAPSTPTTAWQNTELTGRHLATARRSIDTMTGQAVVELEFNSEGADIFEQVTTRNVGRPLAIFLDGRAIIDTTGDEVIDENDLYAPVIQEKISGGMAVISGNMSSQEAVQIAQRLKSGALPVPIELVSQKAVGPTLGRDSLERSFDAAVWGLLTVIVFMIFFYRLPGFFSGIALLVFVLFLLTLFKLIPQITLTMATIGGVILSIGMAVDANILVFERMKEERQEKKSLDRSIENGFQRAWPSIRDGSATTLVVAGLMWFFGAGFIRGFALILGLGVLLSLFSAIFVTRSLLRLFYGSWGEKVKWLWPS